MPARRAVRTRRTLAFDICSMDLSRRRTPSDGSVHYRESPDALSPVVDMVNCPQLECSNGEHSVESERGCGLGRLSARLSTKLCTESVESGGVAVMAVDLYSRLHRTASRLHSRSCGRRFAERGRWCLRGMLSRPGRQRRLLGQLAQPACAVAESRMCASGQDRPSKDARGILSSPHSLSRMLLPGGLKLAVGNGPACRPVPPARTHRLPPRLASGPRPRWRVPGRPCGTP